jgi:rare lipoprotein A (peptidoglycan hydrolase)
VVLFTREPEEPEPPGTVMDEFVAVSPELPAGTVVRVTRLDDGRAVVVRVFRMERLPYGALAITERAGRLLGVVDRAGVASRIEVLHTPEDPAPPGALP